jgi:arginine repressor
MKKRKSRLPEIVDILTHNNIGSQEELSKQLASRGFNVTQATLSRDLKMLRTTKVSTELGGYRYIMADPHSPAAVAANDYSAALSSLHPTAISIAISGNIAVLKTRNGYAGGLAYDIDMLESPHILGTISGADTVFAVINENSTRRQVLEALATMLPPSGEDDD